MARSTRNDAQRQVVAKVEQGLRELAQLSGSEDSILESGPGPDLLNLGHAGLRSECWSSASGRGSGGSRSEFATPPFATLRLRAPRWRRTSAHHSRPAHRAEARFTPDNREMLTF